MKKLGVSGGHFVQCRIGWTKVLYSHYRKPCNGGEDYRKSKTRKECSQCVAYIRYQTLVAATSRARIMLASFLAITFILAGSIAGVSGQCSRPENITVPTATINSPGYPTFPQRRETCIWNFQLPTANKYLLILNILNVSLFQGNGNRKKLGALIIPNHDVNSTQPPCYAYHNSYDCTDKFGTLVSDCNVELYSRSTFFVTFQSYGAGNSDGANAARGFRMGYSYHNCRPVTDVTVSMPATTTTPIPTTSPLSEPATKSSTSTAQSTASHSPTPTTSQAKASHTTRGSLATKLHNVSTRQQYTTDGDSSKNPQQTLVIIVASVGTALALLCCALVIFCIIRRKCAATSTITADEEVVYAVIDDANNPGNVTHQDLIQQNQAGQPSVSGMTPSVGAGGESNEMVDNVLYGAHH